MAAHRTSNYRPRGWVTRVSALPDSRPALKEIISRPSSSDRLANHGLFLEGPPILCPTAGSLRFLDFHEPLRLVLPGNDEYAWRRIGRGCGFYLLDCESNRGPQRGRVKGETGRPMEFIKECHLLFSLLPGEIRVMEFRVAAIFLKVSARHEGTYILAQEISFEEKLQGRRQIQRSFPLGRYWGIN